MGVDSIAETFMCFSPCFDSVFPVFYTFLRIMSGLPFLMFQSMNAIFCLECFNRVISVICFVLMDISCIIVVIPYS